MRECLCSWVLMLNKYEVGKRMLIGAGTGVGFGRGRIYGVTTPIQNY